MKKIFLFFIFLFFCESPDVYIYKSDKYKDVKEEKILETTKEYYEKKDNEKFQFCISNNDGRIEINEILFLKEVYLIYIANSADKIVDITLEGKTINDVMVWDFTNSPSDIEVFLSLKSPENFWFKNEFEDGDFVSPISVHDLSILGIYKKEGNNIYLLGIASKEKEPFYKRTFIKYDNPLLLFSFPLEKNKSWETSSTFSNAIINGIANAGKETYKITVDNIGSVYLRHFKFHNTLRIKIEITQKFVISSSSEPFTSFQYIFFYECIGEVARIISLVGEKEENFKKAKEFRVLGIMK